MIRTGTVSAIGHTQSQHVYADDVYIHRNRGLSTQEQTAAPKHFPIATDDELNAALTARTVVNADLRKETVRLT